MLNSLVLCVSSADAAVSIDVGITSNAEAFQMHLQIGLRVLSQAACYRINTIHCYLYTYKWRMGCVGSQAIVATMILVDRKDSKGVVSFVIQ